MKKEREMAFNVILDFGITEERLYFSHKNWTLYVCDHYWVLDMDGWLEFYYHPQHGLGKIRREELPSSFFRRLAAQCVKFRSGGARYWHGREISLTEGQPLRSNVNFKKLEENLRIGNWFHGQGYNYVTTEGKFHEIVFPYDTWGRELELPFMKLSDMVRMTCSTKTHFYLPSIWDLECMKGLNPAAVLVRPFREEKWDSGFWKSRYEAVTGPHSYENDRVILRFMRQEVFLHTVYLARQGWYLSEAGKKIALPDPGPMAAGTRVFSAPITPERKAPVSTQIHVENMDCLACAALWQKKGYKTALLNMASRQNPGGEVYTGSGSQEGNLFRRTNLFQSLYLFASYAPEYGVKKRCDAYPLERNFGGIYSPGVTVFRGLETEGYPLLEDWFQVDVISVPGMKRPKLNAEGRMDSFLAEGVKNKMRTIFHLALLGHNDCLILGAFGCGSLQNPPEQIAELFHELLQTEYKDVFPVVVFAITDEGAAEPNREGSWLPFAREFQEER